jgi:hypothetical protein
MNYKIRITEENRAIVKRIADENGMNPNNLDFSMFGFYYPILNNLFYTPALIESICTELTTDQFIELFDKKETELDKWLREAKAKNLSLEDLKIYIMNENSCPSDLYKKLRIKFDIKDGMSLAEFLFNQWNNPTEESPKVETERQPKRGDRVLVWDDDESKAEERIFLTEIKGVNSPILVVCNAWIKEYSENKLYNVVRFQHMKPLPIEQPKEDKVTEAAKRLCELQEGTYTTQHKVTYQHGFIDGAKWQSEQPIETDFKSKFEATIKLIENEIKALENKRDYAAKDKLYQIASGLVSEIAQATKLLNKIKELK